MKTIHQFLITVSVLGLSAAWCDAQSTTVNFQAGLGQRDVVASSGLALPDGNSVLIGSFKSDFSVALHANDLNALSGAWNLYGETTIQTLFGVFPGRFSGTESSTSSLFDGQQIWLWIIRTTNNVMPTPDFSNVSEYGLYSSTASTWLFPQHDSVPPGNTVSINSSEVNQALFGSFDANHLTLAQVPEPSTYVLMGLGLGALGIHAFRKNRKPVSPAPGQRNSEPQ